MKPIERGEVLGLAEYEVVREAFRTRVIAEKKRRRLQLGPRASVLFENRDTVLMQIQEMLRTERITRPAAIEHEISTYNESIPGLDELSCTAMIEIADKEERDDFLRAVAGFERHVWLVAADQRVPASGGSRGDEATDRTTAVHYLKFKLPKTLADAIRGVSVASASTALAIEIDHPAYAASAVVPIAMLLELADDLKSGSE
jgi:hypothetical protein